MMMNQQLLKTKEEVEERKLLVTYYRDSRFTIHDPAPRSIDGENNICSLSS